MSRAKIREHEFPGRQLRFELADLDPSSSRENTAGQAVDALHEFSAGLFQPLRADLRLGVFDREFGYALETPMSGQQAWFLEAAGAPRGVLSAPAWVGAVRERVDAIDRDVLHRWMIAAIEKRAVHEDPAAPVILGWREILVGAVRARLFYSAAKLQTSTLQIERGGHTIEYPVERIGDALYVSGPLEGKSVAGPFDVNVTNEGGLLRMTVGVHWSLWTDPNDPGWPELAKALERIQQTGWRCTYSEIDGLGERDA